jgi:hypothetical protein
LTSRLVIITWPLFSNIGSMNDFASIVASIVLFYGVNRNCPFVSNLFLCR